jgi:hypothetical protein
MLLSPLFSADVGAVGWSNSVLRSGREPVTAVKREDLQPPLKSKPHFNSSASFPYLISVIQHVPGIDLTALCRRQYFRILIPSPCKRFVTAGYAQRQLIVRCTRCTCGIAFGTSHNAHPVCSCNTGLLSPPCPYSVPLTSSVEGSTR